MTESKYKFTDLSGSFDITVEVDEDRPEPVPNTVQRALDELTAKGIAPKGAIISTLSVSAPVADIVRCSVSWVTSKPWLRATES